MHISGSPNRGEIPELVTADLKKLSRGRADSMGCAYTDGLRYLAKFAADWVGRTSKTDYQICRVREARRDPRCSTRGPSFNAQPALGAVHRVCSAPMHTSDEGNGHWEGPVQRPGSRDASICDSDIKEMPQGAVAGESSNGTLGRFRID